MDHFSHPYVIKHDQSRIFCFPTLTKYFLLLSPPICYIHTDITLKRHVGILRGIFFDQMNQKRYTQNIPTMTSHRSDFFSHRWCSAPFILFSAIFFSFSLHYRRFVSWVFFLDRPFFPSRSKSGENFFGQSC